MPEAEQADIELLSRNSSDDAPLEDPRSAEYQHGKCDELVSSLNDQIIRLRIEKEEYKHLLFEKVGLVRTNQAPALEKKTQIPLRGTKLFSQKKAELEQKYRANAKKPENNQATAGLTGTVTE